MKWHYSENKRSMPWKGQKDPYKIWLSEIILQQTRVAQGLSYYERFIENYPSIRDLADAKDEEVYKLWEGLGYYTRCKNLLETARHIVLERNGHFPDTYKGLVALKGVGPYTAAAIASFAFGLPHPVLDGNVFRVLSRLTANATPIDGSEGKKLFQQLAASFLHETDPAGYNQAIMDFGATICKPISPDCGSCPLRPDCRAFGAAMVNKLPVKEKTIVKKKRWFNYCVIRHGGSIWASKRPSGDIWEGLFEFYLIETPRQTDWTMAEYEAALNNATGLQCSVKHISGTYKQELTHQTLQVRFIETEVEALPTGYGPELFHDPLSIAKLPFPKIINQYLASPARALEMF